MSDHDVTAPTPLPVPQPAEPPKRHGNGRTLLVATVLSLSLTLTGLYLYDLKFAQKLMVFDMSAFLNEQRTLLVAGKTEESDRRFNELETYLNNLPANHVVLLKSVAVRNATEIKP